MARAMFTFGLDQETHCDTLIRMDGHDSASSMIMGDRSILISDDGTRQAEHLHNIVHKKRRVRLLPKHLNDSLATWIPVNDSGCEVTEAMDSITGAATDVRPGTKRKRYTSSVGGPVYSKYILMLKGE
jgi:hypothetical protein